MANEMQSLQSGPATGPQIATFDWCTAAPERLAIGRAIRTACWRKFMQRRDAIGTRALQERSNSWRNRN
jgi:hypothetical protein